MTTYKAKEILSRPFNMKGVPRDILEAHKMAIKALEQEPCEDCISRQTVLDYIEGSEAELGHSSENELVCHDIKELPPIQPKAKVGKWIRWHEEITTDNGVIEYKPHCKCSECNKEYDSYSTRFMNYCPNCGAEMQEVEE